MGPLAYKGAKVSARVHKLQGISTGFIEGVMKRGPDWMHHPAVMMVMKLVLGVIIIVIGHNVAALAQSSVSRALQRSFDARTPTNLPPAQASQASHASQVSQASQAYQAYQASQASQASQAKSSLVEDTAGVVVYWSLMFLTLIVLLGTLGVEVTGIIAVAGTLGFALGLSLQGFLADVAAGLMLGCTNRYNMGDLITTNGITGTVVSFTLLTTVLQQQGTEAPVTLPNSKVYGDVLVSVASRWDKQQRATLIIVTIANTNLVIAPAMAAVQAAVAALPGVLAHPPVTVGVAEVTAKGTDLDVRFSLHPDDMRIKDNSSLTGDVTTLIRATLVEQGIALVTCV